MYPSAQISNVMLAKCADYLAYNLKPGEREGLLKEGEGRHTDAVKKLKAKLSERKFA